MGGCAAWHVVIGGVWLPLQAGKRKGFNPPPPSFGCWMADSWPAFSISILGVAIPVAVGGAFGAGKAVEWNGKWSGVEWNWGDTKT